MSRGGRDPANRGADLTPVRLAAGSAYGAAAATVDGRRGITAIPSRTTWRDRDEHPRQPPRRPPRPHDHRAVAAAAPAPDAWRARARAAAAGPLRATGEASRVVLPTGRRA